MEVHLSLSPMMALEPLEDKDMPSRKRSQEMKVLADGNVMKLQKTRQRKILSCVYCHSKKIKCSRAQPVCNNCTKLGIECKYFVNERVSRGGRKKSEDQGQADHENGNGRNGGGHENGQNLHMDMVNGITAADINGIHATTQQMNNMMNRTMGTQMDVSSSLSSHSSQHRESDSSGMAPPSDQSEYSDLNGSPGEKKKTEPLSLQDSMHYLFGIGSPGPKQLALLSQVSYSPETPSILQAPIVNSMSHNITNNFFNTNYATNNPNLNADDQYSFNLSSFTFTPGTEMMNPRSPGGTPGIKNEMENEKVPEEKQKTLSPLASSTNISGMYKNGVTNFIDGPSAPNPIENISTISYSGNLVVRNSQPNNPGLHNSLNAYSSNPATTVNYLYGTNSYYDNENLLTDLLKHLPNSKERSFELIDRYVNSVHILLPIMVNLSEFIKEHEKYWDIFDPYKNHSPSSSSSSASPEDFHLLQFYTLYFPVLYASTISEFEEYDNLLLNQDINKYLKGFNKLCQYYNYPHGLKTIPLLLGNVIIQSTSPNPSTMEMSQIIRYAKFLQFHKDPVISLRIADWQVVKFRRLLWWVIFGLDGLSSHNFCLPPVCKFEDFNVVMPEDEDPVFDENGVVIKKKLNVTMLAMTVKFKYDRILSELVYQLHNGLSTNISPEETNDIKAMIVELFHFIHKAIIKMNNYYGASPPTTVQEMNLLNFIKNHSWSFVDRALMLLHKKILLRDPSKDENCVDDSKSEYVVSASKERGGVLSLSQHEDTFGRIQEANIISNFDNSSISQLRFNQYELFTYESLHNNLIPSILHNLNDFLKYNDFIKFGKFNWYIKRTIPLDLIILLFVIICVKIKYEFMTVSELVIYVKLINKALFILNRKYFKNEKYKRMLSLTNLTWEFILKKHNIIKLINVLNDKKTGRIEFFDYQVSGYMNMSELFNVMDVPQPALISNGVNLGSIKHDDAPASEQKWEAEDSECESPEGRVALNQSVFSNQLVQQEDRKLDEVELQGQKLELLQLNEKIYYDLRNNFVDINDYCTFYSSLENVLHELMEYIDRGH